jgi:hypothetical protein
MGHEFSWRKDPALAGKFHPSYPDDVQILLHDGEPRRSGLEPELCWVRVVGHEDGPERPVVEGESGPARSPGRRVYVAALLNRPHQLASLRQGDRVRFLADGGGEHPVMVTGDYLAERADWQFQPCSSCGLCEGLDPPSVMAATRFPDMEGDPIMFTAQCPLCGGMQQLRRKDAPAP